MSNEEMTKRIAVMCCSTKPEASIDFAVQLFFERLLLPPEVEAYTEEEMEERILSFLKTIG